MLRFNHTCFSGVLFPAPTQKGWANDDSSHFMSDAGNHDLLTAFKTIVCFGGKGIDNDGIFGS